MHMHVNINFKDNYLVLIEVGILDYLVHNSWTFDLKNNFLSFVQKNLSNLFCLDMFSFLIRRCNSLNIAKIHERNTGIDQLWDFGSFSGQVFFETCILTSLPNLVIL